MGNRETANIPKIIWWKHSLLMKGNTVITGVRNVWWNQGFAAVQKVHLHKVELKHIQSKNSQWSQTSSYMLLYAGMEIMVKRLFDQCWLICACCKFQLFYLLFNMEAWCLPNVLFIHTASLQDDTKCVSVFSAVFLEGHGTNVYVK